LQEAIEEAIEVSRVVGLSEDEVLPWERMENPDKFMTEIGLEK
jgi:hypothetical protein